MDNFNIFILFFILLYFNYFYIHRMTRSINLSDENFLTRFSQLYLNLHWSSSAWTENSGYIHNYSKERNCKTIFCLLLKTRVVLVSWITPFNINFSHRKMLLEINRFASMIRYHRFLCSSKPWSLISGYFVDLNPNMATIFLV